MRRIMTMFLMCLVCGTAYAATTCLHNRTALLTVKKSANGISSSYNADDNTWSVTFDYDLAPNNPGQRTITGAATCNEIDTNAADATIKSGEANVYLRATNADIGTQCWCSMSAPISSWWVFFKTYDSEDACAAGCARDCADAMKNDTDKFRSAGLYLAIW